MRSPLRKAVFDLDNTIVEGVTGLQLALLLEEITQDHDKWRDFWKKQKLFSNGTVTYDQAIVCLSECFARAVQGMEFKIMKQAIQMLSKTIKIKEDFDKFHSWLIKKQFQIFVMTASPIEVFDAISRYRFKDVYGLVLDKTNAYTGRVITPMTVQNKCRIVDKMILKGSSFTFGVSDLIYDMDAFKNLNLRFLLGDQFKTNDASTSVRSFQEIITILESALSQKK